MEIERELTQSKFIDWIIKTKAGKIAKELREIKKQNKGV